MRRADIQLKEMSLHATFLPVESTISQVYERQVCGHCSRRCTLASTAGSRPETATQPISSLVCLAVTVGENENRTWNQDRIKYRVHIEEMVRLEMPEPTVFSKEKPGIRVYTMVTE